MDFILPERLEPNYPKTIGYDYYGDEIYDSEDFYDIEGTFVLPDNIARYAKEYFKDSLTNWEDYLIEKEYSRF